MRHKTGSHSKTGFATLAHWLDHVVQDDLLREPVIILLKVIFVTILFWALFYIV